MKFSTSDADISTVFADAIVLPADSNLEIDVNFFGKAGPSFQGHYGKMQLQQKMKFPLTEPTVQHVEPGSILNCKGIFLVFPGSMGGKKPAPSDAVNVLEAYKLVMDQIMKMDYKSVAIILSPTDSKSAISEILYSVTVSASKNVSIGEVTLLSTSKSVLKTTRTFLGGASRESSSSKETNAFLLSLTAASTSILKSSARMPQHPFSRVLQGWAMKRAERASKISDEIGAVITDYFHKRRGEGKRALAREICASIKEMKNDKTRAYLFRLENCPKESQCQTIITTLLREERSQLIRTTSLKKTSKRMKLADKEEESEEESSDDNAPNGSKDVTDVNSKGTMKRRSSMMTKPFLHRATNPIFEDEADEYADFMEEIEEKSDQIF